MFLSIANLDIEPAQRQLELCADGVLIEAKDLAQLEPQTRTEVDHRRRPAGRIGDRGPADGRRRAAGRTTPWRSTTGPGPSSRPTGCGTILIVGEGDPYLENALLFLPNVNLFTVKPADYPAKATRTDGSRWDLIVFEGIGAEEPRARGRRPAHRAAGDERPRRGRSGTLTDPGIGTLSPDEPILKFIDLSTRPHRHGDEARARRRGRGRSSPVRAGSPLLYVGENEGQRAGVLAFLPRNSDLPLQVAFPLLMANLTGELMGGSAAPDDGRSPRATR